MVDVTITARRARPDEGQRLRDVRLAALTDAPSAFASSLDAEADRPLEVWDERAIRKCVRAQCGDVLGGSP